MAKLTDMQEAFVLHMTNTPNAIGNATEAARLAGYSEKSAGEIGYQLLQKPHVQQALREANQKTVCGSLAAKAVQVLKDILEDEDASPRLRLDAAKTVLDRAGYVPPKAEEQDYSAEKDLTEMTVQELEQFIRDAKAKDAADNKPQTDAVH